MRIKVLQHHIDEGISSDPYACPIALAIREQHPQIENVIVHGWIVLDGYWWETPNEAMKFISDYDVCGDNSLRVHPFEFDLPGEGNKVTELVTSSDMYDTATG